ncbi:MAG: hypothetical protein CM1200mP34_5140 [Verrucomicrobiales bacterium]|nr:MAG: hypothetical protein CM1200mP34_5140 [Verrucomicrobiales bacterium]
MRLSTAFEIHWNRIALFEKAALPASPKRTQPRPICIGTARREGGFARAPAAAPRSTSKPATPRLAPAPLRLGHPLRRGRRTRRRQGQPTRTHRRRRRVDARFNPPVCPPRGPGTTRHFFLSPAAGTKTPIFTSPRLDRRTAAWHGMDSQRYGREPRPKLDDGWIKQYNTRWIGPPPSASQQNSKSKVNHCPPFSCCHNRRGVRRFGLAGSYRECVHRGWVELRHLEFRSPIPALNPCRQKVRHKKRSLRRHPQLPDGRILLKPNGDPLGQRSVGYPPSRPANIGWNSFTACQGREHRRAGHQRVPHPDTV